MKIRLVGLALLRAAAFFALWLVLVDAVDEPDLVTGGVCAVVAAAAATLVSSVHSIRARPTLAMLRYVYRPLTLLVTDTARVAGALFSRLVLRKPVTGHLRAVRYRAVGDGPDDVARRIMTEWAASTAPNRYAIGIDTDRRLLLVHELVNAGGPLDPLELG